LRNIFTFGFQVFEGEPGFAREGTNPHIFQYLRDGRLLKNQFGSELESKLVEINGNGG
jgi:hypothetical protein